jgi:hypothetical protein
MPVIPALGGRGLKQEDCEFEVNLGSIMNFSPDETTLWNLVSQKSQ